jgi:GxxExxY protein
VSIAEPATFCGSKAILWAILPGTPYAIQGAMTLAPLPEINPITSEIIKAAVEVHRGLGPGLLESVYLACLLYELHKTSLKLETQKAVPVVYKEVKLDCGFRVDLIVEAKVIVEVKSMAQLAPVHRSQLLTYLALTGCPAGLLINFNVPVLKEGLTRVLHTKT